MIKKLLILSFLLISFQSCNNAIQKNEPNLHFKKMTCYFFFIPDCPVCINNFVKVGELEKKYKLNGLEIRAIYSDPFPDTVQLNKAISESNLKIPITFDSDLKFAKKYNITTTPQFVLIDTLENVLYSGAIDNYYYALGKHRKLTSEKFLASAIESVLKGRKPEIGLTEPIGCKINYNFTRKRIISKINTPLNND